MDVLKAAGTLQLAGHIDDASVNILFVLRANSVQDVRAALAGDPYAALGVIDGVRCTRGRRRVVVCSARFYAGVRLEVVVADVADEHRRLARAQAEVEESSWSIE